MLLDLMRLMQDLCAVDINDLQPSLRRKQQTQALCVSMTTMTCKPRVDQRNPNDLAGYTR
jgi:hypothetical protein